MSKSKSTYNEMLQKLADKYFDESGKATATAKEIAVWAINEGHWDPPSNLVLSKAREDFSRALREQYISNDQGQPVRAKHVARITKGPESQYLWGDIRTAKRKHMETAFRQRREQIVGDCRQLKRDVDYYNSEHTQQKKIQLVFDFTDDIEEGEQSTEYPSKQAS